MRPSTRLLAPILALLLGSLAAAAEDAFEERVRTYLLNNPEIIVEALSILAERERAAETRARIAEHPHLFDKSSALGLGEPEARIHVIEFFDYKCVPCKAVHPKLVEAVDAHPELRIEMRHLPILSPASERAARFALAVREVASPETYEHVHRLLWQHSGPMNSDVFADFAQHVGLDFATLEAAMYSDAVSNRITAHRNSAIALEIVGTPAFLTPDTITVGPGDIDTLVQSWVSQ